MNVSRITLSLLIGLNALCAGGMFTFPLLSPSLIACLKLSQTQLTTIVLAGMTSQYPIAVFVGWLIDHYGPSLCAAFGGFIFAIGYTAFAWEVDAASSDGIQVPPAVVFRLACYFLLIGLGTVFSYLSSLFAASRYFPEHIGLASGFTMALFGLSPLFLSVIATTFFMDPTTRLLNVSAFLYFLSTQSVVVNIGSSFSMHQTPLPSEPPISIVASRNADQNATEDSPLLARQLGSRSIRLLNPSVMQIIASLDFWLLAIFCVFILGTSEMIIATIGSIVLSLPPASRDSPSLQHAAALQVKLISLANTISRLIIGSLADFTSPSATATATHESDGVYALPAKYTISRFSFLSGAALLLTCTLLWTRLSIYFQDQLWMLSVGTGFSYSAVFTVLPNLISSLWGSRDLGRNFGLMMYAPFTGTPLFSCVYALISASHTDQGVGTCKGRQCWELTISLCTATSLISLALSIILWKKWRGAI